MKYYFAPMEGITTHVFRAVHSRRFPGADRYYTPFFSPTSDHLFTPRELRELTPETSCAAPVVPQILSKCAADIVWAAEGLQDMGYTVFNLNLGCPSATVTAKGKGAGLLQKPDALDTLLADVFAAHLESGADITAVCTANGGFVDNATYLTLESDGAIGQVWCAPTAPRGHRSLEIYILSKQLLLTLVDECSAQDKYSFRRDVLAGMTGRLKLQSYVWDGYAAQLRSVQEYYDRSMELLQGSIRAELFAAARPILAKEDDEASSYFAPGSRVKNSLVADGCTIEGSVENCILFPGVTVEKGAELRDSILFKGTRVRDGVTLRYVITDKYVEVLPGRTLMGHESYPIVISKGSIV